tara:strand:+ start:540 stop:1289 length:750 start_codon:yes stop_codon:yes gene_type:complete
VKISLCAFGLVGYELLCYCAQEKHPIELVVVKQQDSWADKIINECDRNDIPCRLVKNVNTKEVISEFRSRSIDLCLLLWWPDIVRHNLLDSVNIGFINLHPSLLPYNRGMHPYYWSIINDTPAGVSIHFINSEIDSGSVLYQQQIETSITTTGQQLYELNQETIIKLFKERYCDIINTKEIPPPFDVSNHPVHYRKDLGAHSQIILENTYTGKEIINIIRARTFDGGESAYFVLDDKKYFVKISIEEEK